MQVANSPVNEKKGGKLPLVALVVVVIILSAGFGYYYLQASTQISNLNSQNSILTGKLSTANSNLAADQNQISLLNGNISSLQSTISVNNQNIASLRASVQSDNTSIGSLNTKVLALNENISELKGNLDAEKSQVSNLNTQISQLQSNETSDIQQISQLQGQVNTDKTNLNTLQGQVTSLNGITSMSEKTFELTSKQVSIPQNGFLSVLNFTASYPGYILISSTSTGNSTFAESADQVTSTEFSVTTTLFIFSYSTTSVILPVGPGQIYVYYGDHPGSTTNLTITYYY
ncbi:MAG TPA: hypothetical protein VN739_10570 [Nitrososphaerales archaeon]|nr:hypothetical protein [Nitrososphaerales archaeon]